MENPYGTGAKRCGRIVNEGAVIPTYFNDMVVRIPPARTPELDKKLLRATGRRLAEGYITSPPLLAAAE
ncbi:MAG: hypothetical protein JO358_20740 [Alphaproteobacteria bacterium]|nr:hypothetical protein [Alphaproteobacteria bacterium]